MNPYRKPLIAGNWKMHKTVAEALDYAARFKKLLESLSATELPDVVLCSPFTALHALSQQLSQESIAAISLGAQNMAACDEGAFTGEIAPRMLSELGVAYVILGHSERREYFHESDADVNAKIKTALRHQVTPIACVGESLSQREAGQTDEWVQRQVIAALQGLSDKERQKIVFAYEPIWAIGTGKVCDAVEANRVIGLIRQTTGVSRIRVLYGGSMKPDNAEGLLAQPEIDGGLVGGASLDPDSFFQIVQAAMPVKV